jgi:hypothetical protein
MGLQRSIYSSMRKMTLSAFSDTLVKRREERKHDRLWGRDAL